MSDHRRDLRALRDNSLPPSAASAPLASIDSAPVSAPVHEPATPIPDAAGAGDGPRTTMCDPSPIRVSGTLWRTVVGAVGGAYECSTYPRVVRGALGAEWRIEGVPARVFPGVDHPVAAILAAISPQTTIATIEALLEDINSAPRGERTREQSTAAAFLHRARAHARNGSDPHMPKHARQTLMAAQAILCGDENSVAAVTITRVESLLRKDPA